MKTPTQILLSDIEAFLVKSEMPPSEFGLKAVGDPSLIKNLREGREPRFNTVKRVRSFMLDPSRVHRPKRRKPQVAACA